MDRIKRILNATIIIGLLVTFNFSSAVGQDIRASLFKDADAALTVAKKAKADVLSPKSFEQAMKHYKIAEADFKKGENLEEIRKQLRAAVSYFNKAVKATELANVTLKTSMKARHDAQEAEAPKYAKKLWEEAEKQFDEAGHKLEKGDMNAAKNKSGEAESLYRKAELSAIKATYLADTWELLEKAKKIDADDHAPKTLQRAQTLVKQAEKQLNESRYDTDEPRSIAQEANYEARHAIYLTNFSKEFKDSDQKIEDIVLASEKPLQKIAGKLDISAKFDAGYDATTEAVVKSLGSLQENKDRLSGDVNSLKTQVETLSARITEMEGQLGGIEKEKSQLSLRIKQQAENRKRFATVAELFDISEARVFREGENVIIRLYGLTFPVNKSIIEPQYFGLLTKVQRAINEFSGCMIDINGHTDSHGSDEQNLKLSNERAEAVRQYLLANMNLDTIRIKAVGFGENDPVASNETQGGRAKNRRIDVVITPAMSAN
ncbi:MAG: hypothetical protein DWQ05_04760 [Calditrichaeota bacterium]|nr:MAG: hypothetical protein DWQ05_04760 [Calditrichota bacterium]